MAKSIPCHCGFSRLVAFFHSFSRHYRTLTAIRLALRHFIVNEAMNYP
jgi:predicted metal-dependent HD superfamily phosphohydrolase